MVDELRSIMDEIVVESTRDLFRSLGAPVVPGAQTFTLSEVPKDTIWVPERPVHAICGFDDPELHGDIVIRLDAELLSRVIPLDLRDEAPAEVQRYLWDWAREIANQLTCRIKAGLLGYGRQIKVASPINLPCYAHGARNHLAALDPWEFRSVYGRLTVFVSACASPEASWRAQPVSVGAAGQVFMFD